MHREDIEQFAFLYLCGTRDRKLLLGREKMSFADFDRLIYITAFLGLLHYNLKMWNQYSVQFQSQLEALNFSCERITAPLDMTEYEEDIRKQEQWLTEFCSNAPNQGVQEYLRNVVNRN
ncbi:MAG: hypothetical protein HFH19_11075 [Ruminococcus sp.]|nr:hypothetical protein [Ruminococcus sp.]